MRPITVLVLALALAGCGTIGGDNEADLSDYEDEEYAGETYSEFDERRDSYEGDRGSFADYGCTQDCSGHEAGYAWAQEKGIDDPDNCGGNSWSFEEGCRAYADEQSGY